jgi:hypothetical protein
MKEQLNLNFKGERNYLQGPDILNETMLLLEQYHQPQKITKIEFSFHKMARSGVELHDHKSADLGEHLAECTYLSGMEAHHVYLYESGNPVLGRYPYDEGLICKDFQIDVTAKRGSLESNPAFTDMEIWIALTKALHQAVLSDVKGKWLFVRARLPEYKYTANYSERSLQIVSNFQNLLTRTKLFAHGNTVGEIFFSII